MARGFAQAAGDRITEVLSGHVDSGWLPGAVFGVSRGEETVVRSVGAAAVDGPAMPPDALFRITSMTRPVTAVATLMLIDEGRVSLDEPVDRLLPELANRRVLRRLDGPVEDTVPAERAVTVRDLLTFRGGFGMILGPVSEYPILQAEQKLGLGSVGPPVPATQHTPDEWIRRMGTLPLMDQPGSQWRCSTGSMILGVLISRAAEQPLDTFFRHALFEPLGMDDTGFTLPRHDDRILPDCYQYQEGALQPVDDGGMWYQPPVFPDAGGGLLSTVGDYLTFAKAVLRHGTHRGYRMLSADLVSMMTTDHLSPSQRTSAGIILGGRGWGFGLSILPPPEPPTKGPKGYGWSGGFGTVWLNDPDEDLAAVLCTQLLASEASFAIEQDFWHATYGALSD